MVLDTNSYSVPPEHVGKSVLVRADDITVRVVNETSVIAEHPRCWERRRAIEKPEHLATLIERRPGAKKHHSKDHIASSPPSAASTSWRSRAAESTCTPRSTSSAGSSRSTASPMSLPASQSRSARAPSALATSAATSTRSASRTASASLPSPWFTGRRDADEMSVEPHDLGGYHDLF